MDKKQKQELLKVLHKRAVGYTAKDENEEYAMIEGELILVKRKVSFREIAPELAAIKMLLDEQKDEELELNEEQLLKERDRLLKILFSKKDIESGKSGEE